MGILRLQQGKLDEAEPCLQAALEQSPTSWQARLNLGNVFRERSEADAAIEQYEAALAISPDCAEALLNLGELLVEQCRFADAIPHLRRASELRPRVAEIRLRLADAQREIGEHSAAIESYQRALAFKASSFDGWIGLGLSNLTLERWTDAVSSLRNAVSLQPKTAEAHEQLAKALRHAGQSDEATRHESVANVLRNR